MLAASAMIAIAAAAWGLWSLVLRPAGLPPTITSPLAFVVMGLAPLPLCRGAMPGDWNRRIVWLLFGNALFDAVNMVTFFAAIGKTTVAIAVLSHYAAPLFIAVVAPYIDGVHIRGARIAALLAFCGLALVLEPWRGMHGGLYGAGLGLTSAGCYAGNVFTGERLTRAIGPARALSYHSLLAAAMLFPLFITHTDALTARGVGILMIGAVIFGAGAGIVYLRGLAVVGATRAGMLAFLEPLVAVIVGIVVWHETTHALAILGALIILGAGVYVVRASNPKDG